MPRPFIRLAAGVLIAAACQFGQQPIYTLRVDVPWVTVDVTATDASGKTVAGLTAADFQIYENGVRQQIHSFAPVAAPYNILLLFDRSGSTEHEWQFMLHAAAGFIANLRPQDRVAIDSFDFGFEPIIRWMYKRNISVAALSEVTRPHDIGGTAFYQAVETAVRHEFIDVTGRRAVVVLTDGRDTSLYNEVISRNRVPAGADDRKFQKVLKEVREQHIPVYFVAVNTDMNFEPNTGGADEYRNLQKIFPNTPIPDEFLREVRTRMEQLAEYSGGRILYPRSIEDILPMYAEIGRELGTAYSLAYVADDSRSDGSVRRIEVRATDGTLRLSQSRTLYVAKR